MLIYLLALIDDEADRRKFTMIFNQYHHRTKPPPHTAALWRNTVP